VNPLTLFQLEFIKTSRRVAFWVAAGIFALFGILFLKLAMGTSGMKVNGQAVMMALPNGWVDILGLFKKFSVIYVPVTIILIAASEFTYKTARQNVIDGLSKESFFAGKVQMVLLVTLMYFLIPFLLSLFFHAIADKPAVETVAAEAESLIRSKDVGVFSAYLVCLFGYGMIALFFAFLTRSAGTGIAFCILYILTETVVVTIISNVSEALRPVLKFLPTLVLDELMKPLYYDADALKKMTDQIEAAKSMGQEISESQVMGILPNFEPPIAFALAAGYIVVIGLGTYLLFKRRDL
jgi:ABC-2 type transport system permease protein